MRPLKSGRLFRRPAFPALAAGLAVLGWTATLCAAEGDAGAGDQTDFIFLITEQLLLLATVVGTVATLPTLIEFMIERRKRKERLALSLDDVPVEDLHPRIAGLEDLLGEIADLIDRARNPAPYAGLSGGNEILIIGPPLYGKQSLAQRIAREAGFDRVITVYNPRNKDALAKAKSLIGTSHRNKVMLLLPRIDTVFEEEDDDLLAELDALIETTSDRANVLVVGTAVDIEPDSNLDNLFGTKLVLPVTPRGEVEARHAPEEARRMLAEVARFYLREAMQAGFRLERLHEESLIRRLLECVGNAAEIEDILVLCRTTAIHHQRSGKVKDLAVTPEILDRAIGRVIVHVGSV